MKIGQVGYDIFLFLAPCQLNMYFQKGMRTSGERSKKSLGNDHEYCSKWHKMRLKILLCHVRH